MVLCIIYRVNNFDTKTCGFGTFTPGYHLCERKGRIDYYMEVFDVTLTILDFVVLLMSIWKISDGPHGPLVKQYQCNNTMV